MHKYKLIAKKGEGTFSEVLKAQSLKTSRHYAIKCMKNTFESIEQVNNLREIQALRRLSGHRHIIRLHEVLYDEPSGRLALVMELMDMNLYEAIKNRRHHVPETKAAAWMYQLMLAVDHMHKNGIFHRDIKPENLLIVDDTLKLADLGSCRGVYSRQPYTDYISTRWYRSPECLLTDGYYTYKMDIWGAGCVFFEVMALFPLFPGTDETDQISKIHAILGTPPSDLLDRFKRHGPEFMDFNFPEQAGSGIARLLPHASAELVVLLKELLSYNPDDRITAHQALGRPYFEKNRDEDPHYIDERIAPTRAMSGQPIANMPRRTNSGMVSSEVPEVPTLIMPTPAATALDLDESHANPEMTTPSHRRRTDEEDKGKPISTRHEQKQSSSQAVGSTTLPVAAEQWQQNAPEAVGNAVKARKNVEGVVPVVRHPAPFDANRFVAERVMLHPQESLHRIEEGHHDAAGARGGLPPIPIGRVKQATVTGGQVWPGVNNISQAYSTHHHPGPHNSSSTLGSERSNYSYGHNRMGATSGSAVFKAATTTKRGGKAGGKGLHGNRRGSQSKQQQQSSSSSMMSSTTYGGKNVFRRQPHNLSSLMGGGPSISSIGGGGGTSSRRSVGQESNGRSDGYNSYMSHTSVSFAAAGVGGGGRLNKQRSYRR